MVGNVSLKLSDVSVSPYPDSAAEVPAREIPAAEVPSMQVPAAEVPAVDNAPTFSLFGSERKSGKERIMLGPASFVNHSCQPNAVYVCGSPQENEEIFVSYGTNYFGNNNEECACDPCTEKLFRQPIEVPECVSAVGLNSSHVNLTSEVPAASNSSIYANQE